MARAGLAAKTMARNVEVVIEPNGGAIMFSVFENLNID